MSHDVSTGREHGATGGVTAFGSCARDLDFGRLRGERAISQGDDSQQDDYCNSTQDEAARPGRRFSAAVAQGMIDAETAQVVVLAIRVFDVRGHCLRYAPTLNSSKSTHTIVRDICYMQPLKGL